MNHIFQPILKEATSYIEQQDIAQLTEASFIERTLAKFKIKTPHLDTLKTTVTIDQETIDRHNAPSGRSFIPGSKWDVVTYRVPIIGDVELFRKILFHPDSKRLQHPVNGDAYIHKEYSEEKVVGNESLIQHLKNKAKDAINSVHQRLDDFERSLNIFIEDQLKPLIHHLTKKEIAEQNNISNTEDLLNPFS